MTFHPYIIIGVKHCKECCFNFPLSYKIDTDRGNVSILSNPDTGICFLAVLLFSIFSIVSRMLHTQF